MSQEASKFSVASMCHFILGTTCGISARAGGGDPLSSAASGKTLALKKFFG